MRGYELSRSFWAGRSRGNLSWISMPVQVRSTSISPSTTGPTENQPESGASILWSSGLLRAAPPLPSTSAILYFPPPPDLACYFSVQLSLRYCVQPEASTLRSGSTTTTARWAADRFRRVDQHTVHRQPYSPVSVLRHAWRACPRFRVNGPREP